MKLPSYLKQSARGIYYLRLQRGGKDRRISLRTRDPNVAATAAYRFGATISADEVLLSDITHQVARWNRD